MARAMTFVIPPDKELILPVAQQSAEIDMEPDKIRNVRKIAMATANLGLTGLSYGRDRMSQAQELELQ